MPLNIQDPEVNTAEAAEVSLPDDDDAAVLEEEPADAVPVPVPELLAAVTVEATDEPVAVAPVVVPVALAIFVLAETDSLSFAVVVASSLLPSVVVTAPEEVAVVEGNVVKKVDVAVTSMQSRS